MPHKPRGKGREKSAVGSSVTEDLENSAAENLQAGKEHDEPSIVPSTEAPQPDDRSIEFQFNVEESRNVLRQKHGKIQTDFAEISINTSVHV